LVRLTGPDRERLLARAVFVVDKAGTSRYVQVVKELANDRTRWFKGGMQLR
jgi:peroxiredoxin